MERRREAPDEGPAAVRRAEVVADLRAEQRLAEQVERERAERAARVERLRARIERDVAIEALARRAADALGGPHAAVGRRRDELNRDLQADQEVAERTAAELRPAPRTRSGAGAPARGQRGRHPHGGPAQQLRDMAGEAAHELEEILGKLGLDAAAGEPPRRRWATRRAPTSRPASSAWPAAASSSARSTRWRRTSTPRRSRTSRSSSRSATTSSPRWPSSRA